ncbi:MAG TPA: hypothetical protein VFQ82_00355 [Stellaceae bacterium]|jgi:hypothetical protein|nr:hypothetical protein [Stellaceae bacterium]
MLLIPLAPRQTLIVDPDLPEWLPELRLDNIRVGSARLALRFDRDASGYTEQEVIDQQSRLRIHRPSACVAGSDNVEHLVRNIAAL